MRVSDLIAYLNGLDSRAEVYVMIDGNSYSVANVDEDTDGSVIIRLEE